jgi:Tol biopolymer transport system component
VIATNGKIAFSSDMDGDLDIYTMNPDGSGLVNLTNTMLGGFFQFQPHWSPDGTKIALVVSPALGSTQGSIFVMNADGSNPQQLTFAGIYGETESEPKWSPDGSKIAFNTRRQGGFDIYIMNADGTNQHNLYVNGGGTEYDPSWSPDGSKLLFTRVSMTMDTQIVTMNADGTGAEQYLASNFGTQYAQPEWSPDGRLITYLFGPLSNISRVGVMNADGTNKSEVVPSNLSNLSSPDFSPDGKLLSMTGQATGATTRNLFSVPAPTAPLSTSSTINVTATPLTTSGGVTSADWQRTLITVLPLSVSTVSLSGTGGTVTSQPSGINCGTLCTKDFVAGTTITLTATPKAGSRFVNWSGACTSKSTTCTVTMNQARSVIAYFKKR